MTPEISKSLTSAGIADEKLAKTSVAMLLYLYEEISFRGF